MGDAHIPVIDHDAKVIGGGAIGAGDDQVIKFCVLKANWAFDQINPAGGTVLGAFEAHDGFAIGGYWRQDFAGFGAPGAVIAWFRAFAAREFTHGFDFFV